MKTWRDKAMPKFAVTSETTGCIVHRTYQVEAEDADVARRLVAAGITGECVHEEIDDGDDSDPDSWHTEEMK
jgi:hypothetical protein